ncbi:MAG TPA: hypothetical protein VH158_04255 [Gemmatimonadales bacterium]|jgi:hypothetical protein|nr:hypothetical protein [Gemmatimonadales bacterium]
MNRIELRAWLAARRPTPPAVLRAHLDARLGDAPDTLPLADQLACLGQRFLARVSASSAAGRELALDLLAADALVTYAFEAQAEADVSELAALAARVTQCAT